MRVYWKESFSGRGHRLQVWILDFSSLSAFHFGGAVGCLFICWCYWSFTIKSPAPWVLTDWVQLPIPVCQPKRKGCWRVEKGDLISGPMFILRVLTWTLGSNRERTGTLGKRCALMRHCWSRCDMVNHYLRLASASWSQVLITERDHLFPLDWCSSVGVILSLGDLPSKVCS